MNYLGSLFSHNLIFYALSICISALAAFDSVRLLLLLVVLVAFASYKKLQKMHLLLLVGVGFVSYSYFSFETQKLENPVTLPAVMTWTDEYKINGMMLRGFMKNEQREKVYVTYKIKSSPEKDRLAEQSLAGMQFLVVGEQVEPSLPAHKYGFSMNRYLQSKNARGIVEISSFKYVGETRHFLQPIYEQRFRVKEHISLHFPESLVAEAQALIIGLQENVDEELTRAYQKLGITHLFAISGLHVGLVSWLFFQMLLRFRIRREMASIILLLILPLYAMMAGGAPSVWRAVNVVELVMLAHFLRVRIPIDDALSMSMIAFLCIEPGAIFQVGFQLSYLATYSLIYSSRILSRYSSWLMQSFLITFVCQLLVYPLLLLQFFEISLSSFFVNIIFVPLFSFVILPANLLLLVLTFLPLPISTVVFSLYEPLRIGLTELIFIFQQPIMQMWNPGKPSLFWFILLYCSVLSAFYLLDCRAKFIKIAGVILIPAILFHSQLYLHPDLKIAFVNVGQGDCIVIELPYRKQVIVIDSGGVLRFDQEAWQMRQQPFEVGRQVVVPYLKGRGIQKIDTFILTHADADHVEGAEEILSEIIMKEVHVTPNSIAKPVMNDFIEELMPKNMVLKEQIAGYFWEEAGVHFRYLWPQETEYEGNNDSLVLLVQKGDFRALFTGDLEKEGEQALVKHYPQILQNITLLKAGHHGSKTSSIEEFVQLTNPQLTIFMAGENNRYRHPHPEVVERFEAQGIPFFTTGYDGTVEIVVKQAEITVETSNALFR
ncbi:DNA internalization-related competence protein ComEC/Rec2 [Solibacillus sp. R5-41]|uniref:DNA internalization-related competence protein ComEC/Rec2 n=1 Tax=Solibacillus sp. R5-41 TaxID=2048654 RepID=UPI000C1294E0|nr:DNA internalization-related competence protein ComEC/Rec2 [Solibacillus sp. R5-41]ATP41207.1 DNA internalization-related competence protein ComEC/Rec2 [Solibacillus sp. R5-41]